MPRTFFTQGVNADYAREYRRFLVRVIREMPTELPLAVIMGLQGHHFILFTRDLVKSLRRQLDAMTPEERTAKADSKREGKQTFKRGNRRLDLVS